MKYGNTLNNFEFEGSRAKVKVTVAILEKHCHHSSTFIYGPILLNITQMSSMKSILIKLKVELSKVKVSIIVAILRNTLLAVRCFH